MSSSPLPSLSELVMKIPQSISNEIPISPSLNLTSANCIAVTHVTNSRKSTQVSLSERVEQFKSNETDSASSCTRTVEKLLEKKKPQKKTAVDTGDRTTKSPRPKKTKKTNLSCAYFKEERNDNRKFVELDDSPLMEVRKSQETRLISAKDISTIPILQSEKNVDLLKPIKKSTRNTSKTKSGKTKQPQLVKGKVTKLSASSTSSFKSDESISSMQITLKDIKLNNTTKTYRRRDWTPSTSISNTTIISPSQDVSSFPSLDYSNSDEKSMNLADLFENFAYSKSENTPSKRKSQERGPRKRKLLELVKTNASSLTAPQPKGKALKKKARTLTGLATSAYSEDHGVEQPLIHQYIKRKINEETPVSGLNFLENSDFQKPLPEVSSNDIQISSLLSPGSAIRQVGTQEFVFGTSSQLAREDSPTFLRDLHETMQASNQFHDPFDSPPRVPSGIKYVKKKKENLWNAASRDLDGSLLNVEVVDLAVSPAPFDTESALPLFEDSFIDIDHNASTNSRLDSNIPINISPVEIDECQLPSSPPINPLQTHSLLVENERPEKIIGLEPNSSMPSVVTCKIPNFESYTNAQLAQELSRYRFKAVKKREKMILLLQQCWEGKQRMNSGKRSNSIELKTQEKYAKDFIPKIPEFISPKRVKGKRVQKKSSTVTQSKSKAAQMTVLSEDPEREICNQTHLKTANGLRENRKASGSNFEDQMKKQRLKTPPLTNCRLRDCSPPPAVEISSPVSSPSTSLRLLFDHIGQAIKETPHSKEPSNPSWYEKILLYDPIVLEDLTSWLNTEALQKTNWDGEVDLKDVKKWCESKGICCLFRENLKGNARNRY